MAVDQDTFLPATPAGGNLDVIPLAGNGVLAPHSAYAGHTVLTSDASGGNSRTRIRFDPRYTSLVTNVMVRATSVAADPTTVSLVLVQSATFYWESLKSVALVPAITGTVNVLYTWSPPAMLVKGRRLTAAGTMEFPYLDLVAPNVDTESFRLHFHMFLFDINVANMVPAQLLLDVLTRAARTDL